MPASRPSLKITHILWSLAVLIVAMAAGIIVVYFHVQSFGNENFGSDQNIYTDIDKIPEAPAAIVFGAGINSKEMQDRVITAAQLYHAGKVKHLLMTGDNGKITYNEPEAMKRLAVKQGVPEKDITCDYAGFRTYDSVFRAKDIFGLKKAILVTQAYHLPRALFLAKKLDLDPVGFDAQVRNYGRKRQAWYDLREIGSSAFAWLDVVTGHEPKFRGKKEPIFAPDSN